MNHCAFIGRLTKDVELRYAAGSGKAVGNTMLAVDRKFKKEGQPSADFLPIVLFDKTAEFAAKYFSKGVRIGITGSIQTRSWEDKDKQKHYTTEILADSVFFADGKTDPKPDKPTSSEDEDFEL